jgi:hypothetical protein
MEVSGQLHALRKEPQYPLDRLKRLVLNEVEERTFLSLPGIEPRRPNRSLVDIPAELPQHTNKTGKFLFYGNDNN